MMKLCNSIIALEISTERGPTVSLSYPSSMEYLHVLSAEGKNDINRVFNLSVQYVWLS